MWYQFEPDDLLYWPLFVLLMICLGGSFFFTLSHLTNLIAAFRTIYLEGTAYEVPGTPKPGLLEEKDYPHVTVVICAYNEGEVVPTTLGHACKLDWPSEKLTIQVCDDSTDKLSVMMIKDAVDLWKARGFDVARLTRPDRIGFKAGSLRYNFGKLKGEYVAYFDADHWPEPDYLKNVMPYFYDKKGDTIEKRALVQSPWAFHNTHESLLAELDSVALDIHHVVEQCGRSTNYRMFGFNGTGGVWRKKAVADAGGFTWETVTEDMLMSYRAYMKGYELIYVRHYPQRLEVTADILSHVQQRNRWTKGFLQVFRIYRWTILTSPKVSFSVKYEFFAKILATLQAVLTVLLHLIYPHLKMPPFDHSLVYLSMVGLGSIDAFLTPILGIMAKKPSRNGHYKSIWSRVARLGLVLPFYSLRLGMTMFEAKSIIEGLWSDDATFLTTPKTGSHNRVKRVWIDDMVASIGLLAAVHHCYFYFLVDTHPDFEPALKRLILAWVSLYTVGQVCVSVDFFMAKHQAFKQTVESLLRSGASVSKLVIASVVLAGVGASSYAM